MNEPAMRKRLNEFMAAIESHAVDLVPIMPLDWAWADATEALPDGWAIDGLKRGDVYSLSPDGNQTTWSGDGWTATAHSREDMSLETKAHGNTPAEALVHLAAVLGIHD